MSSIMKGIVDETELDENLHKWFKEKWVRFGPDGKIRGACARGDDSEGKPKCLPQKKAQNLGKKGRKYAASKKRREDPNPERTGKAKNVATKKNTNESVPFNECPSCRGPIVHESMMNEKQDACYHKVKSRYKVWPSAYASGALVQCRKKGASNWGTGKKTESSIMKGIVDEAGSPAQQAAIAINMKKRGEKPKHVDEAKAKQYVKPYNNPQTGEQMGWVSSDGYHKKYWQMFAKASAIKHAKLNPDEVQEDYTGEFAAEKTPTVNPHAGIKDNQFRGAISEGIATALNEMPETSGPVGVQPGGWRKYKAKLAGELDEGIHDQYKIGDVLDKLTVAYKKLPQGTDRQKIAAAANALHYWYGKDPDYMDRVVSGADLLRISGIGKGTAARIDQVMGYDPVGFTTSAAPNLDGLHNDAVKVTTGILTALDSKQYKNIQTMVTQLILILKKINKITNEDTAYAGGMGQGGNAGESYRKFKPKSAGTFKEEQLDKNKISEYNVDDMLEKVHDCLIQSRGQPKRTLLTKLYNIVYHLKRDHDSNTISREELKLTPWLGKHGLELLDTIMDNTSKEEQLDEKCWDTHKQVGMKTKGGKSVPNCVPKESAIMKGLKR